MPVESVRLTNFTAFKKLEIEFSPGVNILIGENGTGKTHLLKVLYGACDVSQSTEGLAEKLVRLFLPSGNALGRLVRRQKGSATASLAVIRDGLTVRVSFSNHTKQASSAQTLGLRKWREKPVESVYIPVKEMLANAPQFRSLYALREVHFEAEYADILDRAFRPLLRGPVDPQRAELLERLRETFRGTVKTENEEFFLNSREGRIEFTLVAEGFRKLGLLWLLIQNGTLLDGSVLFWDEPEANLNPALYGPLVDILLQLHRLGVQVFLTTHDYVMLREFDLRQKDTDRILYLSLYRDPETDEIQHATSETLSELHPNVIQKTFGDIYDRVVQRALTGETFG
ncbi:MAG: AAA family ATPase [Calditrichaeota bacterium]|nr:AAA family ATPase [Calditrichota bacterium]